MELLSAQFQLYLNFFDAIYVSHLTSIILDLVYDSYSFKESRNIVGLYEDQMGQVAVPGLQQSDIEAHRVLFPRKHNILVRWQNIHKFLLFPCIKYMGSVVSPYSLQRG